VVDVVDVLDDVVGPPVVVDVVGPLVVVVAWWLLVGVSSCAVGFVGESPQAARRSSPPAPAAVTANLRRADGRRAAVGRDTAPA